MIPENASALPAFSKAVILPSFYWPSFYWTVSS